MDKERKEQLSRELVELGGHFWAGEAEISRQFFSEKRSADEQARWLRLQVYKEMYGSGLVGPKEGIIRSFLDDLRQRIETISTMAERGDFERDLRVLREEFTHFKLFADALESVTGKPVDKDELKTWQLPEDKKLQAVRDEFRKSGKVGELAIMFTEGGGSSLFFEGKKIGGDPVSDTIAQVCSVIFTDELEHGEHSANDVDEEIDTEEDWAKVREMVTAICQQRLRMRYSMFGMPVDEQRIEEITEGEIEPLKMTV
jgi:hypothetical protein